MCNVNATLPFFRAKRSNNGPDKKYFASSFLIRKKGEAKQVEKRDRNEVSKMMRT